MRVLLLSLLITPAAFAGSWDPLTPSNWETAQKSGGVVLLEFSAAGCSACGVQKILLHRILTSDLDLDVTGLQISLGSDPELERRFAVSGPATLLLLRGGREIARSVGDVSEEEIRSFIDQAFVLERWAAPRARPSNRLPLTP